MQTIEQAIQTTTRDQPGCLDNLLINSQGVSYVQAKHGDNPLAAGFYICAKPRQCVTGDSAETAGGGRWTHASPTRCTNATNRLQGMEENLSSQTQCLNSTAEQNLSTL